AGPEGAAVRTAVAMFGVSGVAGDPPRVRVGIRPEWLRLSPQPIAGAVALDVALVEPLGAEILVHARWPGGELVARAPADLSAAEGGRVWIDAAACRIDLFNETGQRLVAESGAKGQAGSQVAGAAGIAR